MSKLTTYQGPQKSSSSLTAAPSSILQRKCACGNHTVAGGECTQCGKEKNLQRKSHDRIESGAGISLRNIPFIQTKLTVGASNDPLEQEGDRVAERVLAAPMNSTVSGAPPRIQRYVGQSNGQTDPAPISVDRVLASPGKPLDPGLRQDMEQSFGHDFSRVRVHSGAAAEQSAREVNANAYTVGHNVVFGTGRFPPGTPEGRRLIAHELTHVVQQSASDGIRADRGNEKRGLSPSSADGKVGLAQEPTPLSGPGYIEFPPTVSNSGTCEVGHSESNCFPDAGYLIGPIRNNCCTEPCTVEHEVQHVRDFEGCCKAYSQALRKPGADGLALTQAWLTWKEQVRPISECRAYMHDIACAQRLARTKGCVPETRSTGEARLLASGGSTAIAGDETLFEGTAQKASSTVAKPVKGVRALEACCLDINWYEQTFAGEAAKWCNRAGGKAVPQCPFTAKPKKP